jgi:hypothetical protein
MVLPLPEVDVGWGGIVQALAVTPVVVVIDEDLVLGFEVAEEVQRSLAVTEVPLPRRMICTFPWSGRPYDACVTSRLSRQRSPRRWRDGPAAAPSLRTGSPSECRGSAPGYVDPEKSADYMVSQREAVDTFAELWNGCRKDFRKSLLK